MRLSSTFRRIVSFTILAVFALVMGCSMEAEHTSEQNQAQEILDGMNEGSDYYNNLVDQDDPSALQKTVSWLKTQPNIEDAAIGEDLVSICIKFDSGVEGIILTQSFKSLGGTTSIQAKSDRYLQLENNISSRSTTKKNAIILLPFDSVPTYKDYSAYDIKKYLQQSGFSVEIYRDEEVTVDLMKSIPNYEFVYMATHGGIGFYGIGWNVGISTGQIADEDTIYLKWDFLTAVATKGLIVRPAHGTKNSYFGLNKNFFDDYTYPGTFVYMNACNSLKNDTLADAFLNNGASVYLGWDNTTFLTLANLHNPEFFQQLSIQNNTLEPAYNNTIAKHYPATVYKDDNKNEEWRALLLDGSDEGDKSDTTFDYFLNLKFKGNCKYVLKSVPFDSPRIATITSPSDGSRYFEGEDIYFSGTGFDDDVVLTGDSLVWTLDNDWWQIGTGSSFTINNLTTGTHTIILTATYSDGETRSDSVNITIDPASNDTSPPSVPTGLTATVVSSSQINLSWTESTDDFGAIGYKIYRDGVYLNSVTATSASDTGLSPSTEYFYTVSAYDAAGNESNQSTEACATTSSPPNTPPTATITSPPNGANFTEGGEIAFSGSGDDTEDGVLSGDSLVWTSSIDGQIGTGSSFAKTNLSVGAHTITLTATDNEGAARGDSVSITISDDTSPPSIPTGLTATVVSSSQINLSWTESTDDFGAIGYKIYRDGVYLNSVTATSASDTGLSPSTEYCYTVSAYDAAGNESNQSTEAYAETSSSGASEPPSIEWQKTFGGEKWDWGRSVQQTTDNGYIVAGTTMSFGAGFGDVYLIKTDSNGKLIWQKTFGSAYAEQGFSVQQTTDGGYIVVGKTNSFGAGGDDVYLIKTDSNGNLIWQKTFGGVYGDEWGHFVQQTTDGGYIVVGETGSFGAGQKDVYLIKTDSNGDLIWQKTFGEYDIEQGLSVQQTTDGGYILVGLTYSFVAGYYDVYLTKTDSNGDLIWQKTFGGGEWSAGYSVQQTTDGGYIVVGFTGSFVADNNDVYLIKTDSNGDLIWQKTLGGVENDAGYSVQQTTDGGYIVAGTTMPVGAEFEYAYLIKADSNGDLIWQKTLGGAYGAVGYSVWQTTDGGYIVTGEACDGTGPGVYLVKIAPSVP